MTDRSRSRARLPRHIGATCVVAAAVLLGAGLRWTAIAQKPGLTHDEGISYLAATGHLGEFSLIVPGDGSPAARWADAAEWHRYLSYGQLGKFRLISDDLARNDVHPPLYFWMLHVWMAAAGTGVRSGNAFNALLALVAVLVLFAVATWVLRDALQGAFISLIWAVSPHAIAESLEARAYGLLALLTLLFVACLAAALERGRAALMPAAGLALTTAAGALTHYGFLLLLFGGVLFALAATLWRAPRAPGRLAAVGAALLSGLLLAALAHPEFALSFERQRAVASAFSGADTPRRFAAILHAFGGRWAPGQPDAPVAAFVALVMAAAAMALRSPALRSGLALRERAVAFAFLWMLVATLGLYLAQITPAHAMSARYMSTVWILFAFVPAWLVRGLDPRRSAFAFAALGAVWAMASAAFVWSEKATRDLLPTQHELLATTDRVIIDSIARGVLPRVIPDLPARARVFAAPQRILLADPDAWGATRPDRLCLVSSSEYGNVVEGRAAVIARLESAAAVTPLDGGLPGLMYARVEAADPPSARP